MQLHGRVHRIILVRDDEVLMTDLQNNGAWLVDEAGRRRLPSTHRIDAMVKSGEARPIAPEAVGDQSPTARMRHVIEMLEAARVPQGDKAIWIFLTAHWTAALEARFGPHDEPWKIRRWRTALRRAARRVPTS